MNVHVRQYLREVTTTTTGHVAPAPPADHRPPCNQWYSGGQTVLRTVAACFSPLLWSAAGCRPSSPSLPLPSSSASLASLGFARADRSVCSSICARLGGQAVQTPCRLISLYAMCKPRRPCPRCPVVIANSARCIQRRPATGREHLVAGEGSRVEGRVKGRGPRQLCYITLEVSHFLCCVAHHSSTHRRDHLTGR